MYRHLLWTLQPAVGASNCLQEWCDTAVGASRCSTADISTLHMCGCPHYVWVPHCIHLADALPLLQWPATLHAGMHAGVCLASAPDLHVSGWWRTEKTENSRNTEMAPEMIFAAPASLRAAIARRARPCRRLLFGLYSGRLGDPATPGGLAGLMAASSPVSASLAPPKLTRCAGRSMPHGGSPPIAARACQDRSISTIEGRQIAHVSLAEGLAHGPIYLCWLPPLLEPRCHSCFARRLDPTPRRSSRPGLRDRSTLDAQQ